MSVSVAFQDFVLELLKASQAVQAIVGDRVYDGVPSTFAYPYISFGPSDFTPDNADCISGREETLQIDCWVDENGRIWPCKKLVDAVVATLEAVEGIENVLSVGALVTLRVELARAFLDRDNIKAHGVVQVTGVMES